MPPEHSMEHCDVVVIGAGPGGYVAAIRLAQLGKKVTLVEKNALGGVCLNWGCIPSKALIYAASLVDKIRHADDMGIVVNQIGVDMPKLQSWKNGVVKKLTGGIGQLMKAHGVQVIYGQAEFNSAHEITVYRDQETALTLSATNFLIATGSSPTIIPGFEPNGRTIIDSTDALSLPVIPDRLAVLGGGVIGLELGMLYAKLGTDVSIFEMAPSVLPGMDAEVVQLIERALKKRKIGLYTGARVNRAESLQNSVVLEFTTAKGKESSLEVEHLLVSVGRRPNSGQLKLDRAGVQTNDKGFIQIDQQCRTSVSHIFAIGDVTSAPLLAHKASKEGLVAAEVISGKPEVLDYRALPAAVFTDPEIATVGLTEEQASEQGYDIRVGKFPFQASGRAISMNQTEGMVKVIADAKTDLLLGVHMIGPDVSELIAEAALAIEMGATAQDLALTVHTHPTLPESLMEAAEALHHQAIHIFQKEKPVGSQS